jgi:hypothetical protein
VKIVENELVISDDYETIIKFLESVERECRDIIRIPELLDELRNHFDKHINLIVQLASTLKANGINEVFKLEAHPEVTIKLLESGYPLRSKFIILFSYLEVLFMVNAAYLTETADKKILKDFRMNTNEFKNFVNGFILTQKNQYYKQNEKKFCKLNSRKMIDLRNNLVHFFSVSDDGVSLFPGIAKTQQKKLNQNLLDNGVKSMVFIDELELFELIKGAGHILLNIWIDEYKKDGERFNRKMNCVKLLVEQNGAVECNLADLNL